jgi:hypothetical protein
MYFKNIICLLKQPSVYKMCQNRLIIICFVIISVNYISITAYGDTLGPVQKSMGAAINGNQRYGTPGKVKFPDGSIKVMWIAGSFGGKILAVSKNDDNLPLLILVTADSLDYFSFSGLAQDKINDPANISDIIPDLNNPYVMQFNNFFRAQTYGDYLVVVSSMLLNRIQTYKIKLTINQTEVSKYTLTYMNCTNTAEFGWRGQKSIVQLDTINLTDKNQRLKEIGIDPGINKKPSALVLFVNSCNKDELYPDDNAKMGFATGIRPAEITSDGKIKLLDDNIRGDEGITSIKGMLPEGCTFVNEEGELSYTVWVYVYRPNKNLSRPNKYISRPNKYISLYCKAYPISYSKSGGVKLESPKTIYEVIYKGGLSSTISRRGFVNFLEFRMTQNGYAGWVDSIYQDRNYDECSVVQGEDALTPAKWTSEYLNNDEGKGKIIPDCKETTNKYKYEENGAKITEVIYGLPYTVSPIWDKGKFYLSSFENETKTMDLVDTDAVDKYNVDYSIGATSKVTFEIFESKYSAGYKFSQSGETITSNSTKTTLSLNTNSSLYTLIDELPTDEEKYDRLNNTGMVLYRKTTPKAYSLTSFTGKNTDKLTIRGVDDPSYLLLISGRSIMSSALFIDFFKLSDPNELLLGNPITGYNDSPLSSGLPDQPYGSFQNDYGKQSDNKNVFRKRQKIIEWQDSIKFKEVYNLAEQYPEAMNPVYSGRGEGYSINMDNDLRYNLSETTGKKVGRYKGSGGYLKTKTTIAGVGGEMELSGMHTTGSATLNEVGNESTYVFKIFGRASLNNFECFYQAYRIDVPVLKSKLLNKDGEDMKRPWFIPEYAWENDNNFVLWIPYIESAEQAPPPPNGNTI